MDTMGEMLVRNTLAIAGIWMMIGAFAAIISHKDHYLLTWPFFGILWILKWSFLIAASGFFLIVFVCSFCLGICCIAVNFLDDLGTSK